MSLVRPITGVICALALSGGAGCMFEELELELIPVPDAAPPDVEVDAPICVDGVVERCYVTGECVGRRACLVDVWGPCEPVDEVCDEADNDCDGATDEDFPGVGDACSAGIGACFVAGGIVCTDDGTSAACDAIAGDGGAEMCNGIDDDCDGMTDEEAPVDAACDTGLEGACAAGLTGCVAGTPTCHQQVEASDEICDAIDNDCDGAVDEHELTEGPLAVPCYEGPEETRGVGGCTDGVRLCIDGELQGCMGQVLPAVEICDLIDNDCDGEFGDIPGDAICGCSPGQRRACYTGPGETADVGACVVGSQRCLGDGLTFGPCEGEVLPDLEVCDGIDNDCDGVVDDAAGVGEDCSVGVGICASPGTRQCDPVTGFVVCRSEPGQDPAEETCNGLDDDCDGETDEFEGNGEACEVGLGACRTAGARICDPLAGREICRAPPRNPGDELCNGIDDDCDGIVDDIPGLAEPCTVGQGVCARTGRPLCDYETGGLRCPVEPGPPAGGETCNGLDDDCDGETDESGACGELLCGDDTDDDGDGAMDCDDPDCASDTVTCTCDEDMFAGNALDERAAEVTPGEYTLSVCGGSDWFRIRVCHLGVLTVTARGRNGGPGAGNAITMRAFGIDEDPDPRRDIIGGDEDVFDRPAALPVEANEDRSSFTFENRADGGAFLADTYTWIEVATALGDRPVYGLSIAIAGCRLEATPQACSNGLDDDGDGDFDCDDPECEALPACQEAN